MLAARGKVRAVLPEHGLGAHGVLAALGERAEVAARIKLAPLATLQPPVWKEAQLPALPAPKPAPFRGRERVQRGFPLGLVPEAGPAFAADRGRHGVRDPYVFVQVQDPRPMKAFPDARRREQILIREPFFSQVALNGLKCNPNCARQIGWTNHANCDKLPRL